MKITVLIGVTILYGLLFHGAMRLSLFLLGPIEINMEAAVQWRGIGYTALSAASAATISTAVWVWRARYVSATEGWSVGLMAVIFILANLLLVRGLDGLIAFVSTRPLHTLLTYAIVFAAIPICIHAVNSRLYSRTRSSDHSFGKCPR